MIVNLIIDGNYLMSKNVFPLHKNNLLYGGLYNSLEMSVSQLRKMYSFSKIYFVSDFKGKSWRKDVYDKYKENRKKDNNIDWEFVHNTYDEYKEYLKSSTNIKVLEHQGIEGDDWISFLVDKSNKNGISNIIITNDYDIKQLLSYGINPNYINIMNNEMFSKKKVFFPEGYQLLLNNITSNSNFDDIFNITNDNDFINLMNQFIETCEVDIVNPNSIVPIKMISGDSGDNISSAWVKYSNGKKRGIGDTGAKTILEKYISEYGDIDIFNDEHVSNLTDIILESKKLNSYEYDDILKNLQLNKKIVSLDINHLPSQVVKKMSDVYNNL